MDFCVSVEIELGVPFWSSKVALVLERRLGDAIDVDERGREASVFTST